MTTDRSPVRRPPATNTPRPPRRGLELEVLEDRRVLNSSPLLSSFLSLLSDLPATKAEFRLAVADLKAELGIGGNSKGLGHGQLAKAGIDLDDLVQASAEVSAPGNEQLKGKVKTQVPSLEGGGRGGIGGQIELVLNPGNPGGILPGGLPGGALGAEAPPLPVGAGVSLASSAASGQSAPTLDSRVNASHFLNDGPDNPLEDLVPALLGAESRLAMIGFSSDLARGQAPLGTGIDNRQLVDEVFSVAAVEVVSVPVGEIFVAETSGDSSVPADEGDGEAKGSDLLTDFSPLGGPGVDGLLQQLLARLNELGLDASQSLLSRELALWLMAGALAVGGYVHFRRRRPPGGDVRQDATSSSWKWLSGSAGFTPQISA